MLRPFALLIGIVLLPSAALSGAWARDKGELFIAAGGNFLLSEGAQLPVHYDPTLYAEWGVTDRITSGLDIHTADRGQIGTAFGFVNLSVGDTTARTRYAVQVGLGVRASSGNPAESLIRGGVSVGRALDHGWLAVDANMTLGTIDTTWRPKVDVTYGHNWSDRWTTTLQLQTGQGLSDDTYAKISPTVIYSLRPELKIAVGAVQGLTGDRGAALKLETWITF